MDSFLVVLILSCLIVFSNAVKRYDGYKVLTITPRNEKQLGYLKWLWQEGLEYELDFWTAPTTTLKSFDVLVSPTNFEGFTAELKKRKIRYISTTQDLGEAIRHEKKPTAMFDISSWLGRPGSRRSKFSLEKYNRYKQIVDYLFDLQAKYSNRVKVRQIGTTHENRKLYVVKISGDFFNGNKPAIWIDGGIHAREWISPATVLQFIDKLLTKYNSDVKIRKLVDNVDWYIMPVLNPDGYEFSHAEDRMWRKNRSPIRCHRSLFGNNCCQGTDLNRNFDWKWASGGSSSNPCHDTYHGTEPFSEPETKAVSDFILQRKDQLKGYISFHSYSQLWLMPFGHRKFSYPDDITTDLRPIAEKAANALEQLHGTHYSVGTGADLLYPASGGSADWAKGAAKVKFTYLVELRPKQINRFANGFILPESNIASTAEETWEAVKVVAKEIFYRYGRETGTTEQITTKFPKTQPILPVTKNICTDWSKLCTWWSDENLLDCNMRIVKRTCAKSCGFC